MSAIVCETPCSFCSQHCPTWPAAMPPLNPHFRWIKDEPASCRLLQSVHLLPIRYGRVEVAPVDAGPDYPFVLISRPVGYRLLKSGHIYVLDAGGDTNREKLHEYLHKDGELTGQNGGKLEYPTSHTLYVAFSEIAWTAQRKSQVLDDSKPPGGVGGEKDQAHEQKDASQSNV
ncbi:MAG: hypothetical protein ACJARK_000632 [Marinobacter psychrophilus]|jgi:hypothetical protein